MEHIDVRDLPEPVAQAVATMVDTLRRELRAEGPKKNARRAKNLPVWALDVKEPLRREDLYDEHLDQKR